MVDDTQDHDLMFERFTNRARHVVVLAQEEARRLNHNYIGTEHLLLGLMGEPESVAGRVLTGLNMTLDSTRAEVAEIVSPGKKPPAGGHIPFTPRAKKCLELSLREALQLHHNYIGTEHILLGMMREGEGPAVRVLRQHADQLVIRNAVLDLLPTVGAETAKVRRWLRRRPGALPDEPGSLEAEQAELNATPAVDATLSEAARLAGARPVGSHHLLLAALTDANTAAARAFAALGVDLELARDALRRADVTGTSDEPPEDAGRRQMVIRVTDDKLTLEATDRLLVEAGKSAVKSLGDRATPPGTINGDRPEAASLAAVWQALRNSLIVIQQRAAASPPDAPPESTAEAS
jgi:ATP-dependent Clp protease ATP-binding subunit ClpA